MEHEHDCGCCLGRWDHCPRCGCEERHRSEAHPNDARPSWEGARGPATEGEATRWDRENAWRWS